MPNPKWEEQCACEDNKQSTCRKNLSNKLVLIQHKYGILGLISELYIKVIPTFAKFFFDLYVNRYSTAVYVYIWDTEYRHLSFFLSLYIFFLISHFHFSVNVYGYA